MGVVQLREVDSVEVTVLADNYTDVLLPDADVAKRLRILPLRYYQHHKHDPQRHRFRTYSCRFRRLPPHRGREYAY